jgi:hypothetical protein
MRTDGLTDTASGEKASKFYLDTLDSAVEKVLYS